MPELPRLPLGPAIEDLINWLTDNAGVLFEVISVVLLTVANLVYEVLSLPHPYVLIVILAALAYAATRKFGLPIFTLVAFLVVLSIGLWTETLQTLSVVIMATFFALLIGVPVGIWAARSATVSVMVRPVLDFMQTLPVFVYLLPAVFFFGIGVVPGIVATIVFALPPAVRLTELGIRQVDREVVEAAQAFGSKPGQVLREVQIPLAMPSIMAGVNQVIMLALSMVVVAGMVGTEGLGQVVVGSTQNLDIAGGFESGISVVLLAIYLDRLTGGVSRLSQRRGKKKRKAGAEPEEPVAPEEEGTVKEPAAA